MICREARPYDWAGLVDSGVLLRFSHAFYSLDGQITSQGGAVIHCREHRIGVNALLPNEYLGPIANKVTEQQAMFSNLLLSGRESKAAFSGVSDAIAYYLSLDEAGRERVRALMGEMLRTEDGVLGELLLCVIQGVKEGRLRPLLDTLVDGGPERYGRLASENAQQTLQDELPFWPDHAPQQPWRGPPLTSATVRQPAS